MPDDFASFAKQFGGKATAAPQDDFASFAKQFGGTVGNDPTDEANQALAKSGISVSPRVSVQKDPHLPRELRDPTDQPTGFGMSTRNPRTGQQITERSAAARVPIIDSPTEGVQDIGRGVAAMSAPGINAKIGGTSDVIRGLGKVAAPIAVGAALPALAAAPAATLGAVGAGAVGGAVLGKGSGMAARALGASPEVQNLTEDIGGMVGGALGAKYGTQIPNILKTDPRVAIGRALRPTPSQAGFNERIPDTIARIKQANPGYQPAVEGGQLNLSDAAQRAIDVHQAALEPWIQRAKGTTISGEPIVRATAEATQGMLPSEGQSAQSLIERAQQDYGTFTPEQLRTRLTLLNERLSPFYNKSQAAQSSALADIPEAVLKAQRDAVAETLYRHLDPEGEGAGPRLIQSKTGDLIDLLKASQRRNEAINAEQPLTPLGRIVDPVKGAIRSLMPGKATGSGIAFAEGSEGRSLPLLKRAFKSVDQTPNALPQPGTSFYPSAPASRQLGPGPTQMPSAPDASFVRGMPAQAAQSEFRRLPAPPSVREMPPVPDASGDRSWTGPQGPPPPYRQLESGPTPVPQRVSPSSGVTVTPPVDPSGVKLTPARKIVDPNTGKIYYVSEPETQVGPRKPNPGMPAMAKGGVVVPRPKAAGRMSRKGFWYGPPRPAKTKVEQVPPMPR